MVNEGIEHLCGLPIRAFVPSLTVLDLRRMGLGGAELLMLLTRSQLPATRATASQGGKKPGRRCFCFFCSRRDAARSPVVCDNLFVAEACVSPILLAA